MRDPAGLTWAFEPTAALGTVRFKKAVGASLERCERIGRFPFEAAGSADAAVSLRGWSTSSLETEADDRSREPH